MIGCAFEFRLEARGWENVSERVYACACVRECVCVLENTDIIALGIRPHFRQISAGVHQTAPTVAAVTQQETSCALSFAFDSSRPQANDTADQTKEATNAAGGKHGGVSWDISSDEGADGKAVDGSDIEICDSSRAAQIQMQSSGANAPSKDWDISSDSGGSDGDIALRTVGQAAPATLDVTIEPSHPTLSEMAAVAGGYCNCCCFISIKEGWQWAKGVPREI